VLDKIVLEGDSAGAGAVASLLNIDRNIASGALLAVPFLDVFSTMNDETLPLTLGEYSEWGNPNDRESAAYIYNWSPIDNLNNDIYPPILVVVGTNDVRVGFWEGIKYGYKLRDLNKDNVVNLHIVKDGGHNGSSKKDEQTKNKALELLWLIETINN
jgi:oligopeptidase B